MKARQVIELRAKFRQFGFCIVACSFTVPGLAQNHQGEASNGDAVDGDLSQSQARESATKLGYRGLSAYREGDFEQASLLLEQAYALYPAPSLGLWSARTFVQVGRLVEAAERYLETTRLSLGAGKEEIQQRSKQTAQSEYEELILRIPILTVDIISDREEMVEIKIDGTRFALSEVRKGLAFDPGTREVIAVLGENRLSESIVLVEGARATVQLKFVRQAEQTVPPVLPVSPVLNRSTQSAAMAADMPQDDRVMDSSPYQWIGWGGVGVGSGLAVMGGVFGMLAIQKRNSLDCSSGVCPSETPSDEIMKYDKMRVLSSVGVYAGLALAGAGVGVLIFAPKKSRESAKAHVAPYLQIGQVGLKGNF